ncbi:MAG: hypothetical protein ACE5EG_04065, partial [Thermoanaerobaculia bacterium]
MNAEHHPLRRRPAPLGVLLLLVALLGQGVARAEDESAVFFIETITVETERLSSDIVLSESLLREGQEYTEAELREAVHRINRLPFVLLAEFSLRKGSERGLYELVVKVYETRRWFSQLNLGIALNDPVDRFRLEELGDRFGGVTFDEDFDALIGRRFAVGRRGLLFASFGTEDGLFAVGYQHYNLWDRNILFSLSFAGEDQAFTEERGARAQLSVPIRGNHALRLLLGWNRSRSDFGFRSQFDSREIESEIAWVFNSLDDPVLPREGRLVEAGLNRSEIDDRREFEFFDGTVSRFEFHQKSLAAFAAAARSWPLAERQSVSAGVRGFVGDEPVNARDWEAEVNLGHQVFLLRNLEPGKW